KVDLKKFFMQLLVLLVILISLYIVIDRVVFPMYTRHGDEFSLPDLNEKSIAEAQHILDDFGATIIIKDSTYSALVPEGKILSQIPKAYSTVKYGRRVYISVSAGDRPRIVPNLLGLSLKQAEFKLLPLGVKIGTILRSYSTQYPSNTIMYQNIKEGESIAADETIDVTISLGENIVEVEIPNFIGLHISTIEKDMANKALIIEKVQGDTRENLTPGTVIAQSIEAGAKVDANTRIKLTLSQ
ncbi:MAG: PASTA domain-containing protein, partial [Calditrichaeota bacterium]|nr:PASTA domain-containing protein [Calditrichota bacterium]